MRQSSINHLLVIAAILVVLVGFPLLIIPGLNRARADSQKISSLRSEIAAEQDRLKAIESVSTQIDKDPERYKLLQLALPTDPNLPDVFIMIENMAISSKVSLDSVVPDKSGSEQGVKIAVTISGSYTQVKTFLAAITTNVRPIIVNSMLLTRSPSVHADNRNQDESDERIKVDFNLIFVTAKSTKSTTSSPTTSNNPPSISN